MNSPVSSSESSSFSLLDARIQRWIWEAGWTELRDAQERAIPVILEGQRDVIVAASTASGKTEAAFFPILTRLLADESASTALYISPLKALINDQWSRLSQLCESLEIPVIPWHGDIAASRKSKFIRRPRGCLLITPESFEGLLMREGHALEGMLGGLKYAVVDELHAFIDTDRGKQLQSQLRRIDIALDRRVPRIGLSATLGQMNLAAAFLRPEAAERIEIIDTGSGGQELKVVVKGFHDLPPRLTDGEMRARERAGHVVDMKDVLPEGVVAIGAQLYSTLRGTNNLVFPNSRNQVELYADLLRRTCEERRVPNEFWPHHGSLSKEIREETERALKEGERPATAIATTTLELGIDIGAVKSIAQVGPAPSVASLRQRLGRSGRRKGEPAILRCYCLERPIETDTAISDRLREGLVETIAQIRLLVKGWFEPPRIESLHLSTLIQQLLSLIAQYGGVTARQAYQVLCADGPFSAVDVGTFAELLKELAERQVLMQDGIGVLLHGEVGEKIVNHYSFYAAFVSPDEFRVVCDGRALGTLPIDRPLAPGSYLIFAGRRWKVLSCSQEDKVVEVSPAKGGKLPKFDGMGGKVHDEVRGEMRAVLAEMEIVPFLDSTAIALLAEARREYRQMKLDQGPLLRNGNDVLIFSWRGDWVNDTLALLLIRRGLKAASSGLMITVFDTEPAHVIDALAEAVEMPRSMGDELAALVQNKYLGKYDGLLPTALLSKNYASSELDVGGAIECAASILGEHSGAAK